MTRKPAIATFRSGLALRIITAFVIVAIGAVFMLAGLTLWRTKHTVGRLADDRRSATVDAIAQTLGLSYREHGGWTTADSHPATMIALQAGATIEVLDTSNKPIKLRSSMGPMSVAVQPPAMNHPVTQRSPIIVEQQRVGTVVVTFASGELAVAEQHVKDALRGTLALGTIAAALVAFAIAVPLSRRIAKPLWRITDAAQRLGTGDATARAAQDTAPGELGQLARAFDDMAIRLDANEQNRRRLTADISHELRTPLTLLQGTIEELLDTTQPVEPQRIADLNDDLLRMRRLVDDLATLADADAAAEHSTADHHRFDLATLAASVADRFRPLLDANELRLTTSLQAADAIGNTAQIEQVIGNLLSNAIKFTPSGGNITLDVEPTRTPEGARLTISDTGPGIGESDLPHVFERFYRAPATRYIAGTGIGLAVAQQLVAAHGGTITIETRPTGTAVTFLVRNPDS